MMHRTEKTAALEILLNGCVHNIAPAQIVEAMQLVREGADPNQKNTKGNALLHLLTPLTVNHDGFYNEIIKELVTAYKADIDIKNAHGYTPLQCLIKRAFSVSQVMNLVRLGADPNQKNKYGDSLLNTLARQTNIKNPEIKAAIIELVDTYSVDIDSQGHDGYTPLGSLIYHGLLNRMLSLEEIMILVQLGASFTKKDRHGFSPLDLIAANKDERNVENIKALNLYFISYTTLQRNNLLNFLILLVKHRSKGPDTSPLKQLPIDVMVHIISFLDFQVIGRTKEACISLAKLAFSRPNKILNMIATPGNGYVNVLQRKSKPKFIFFRSASEFTALKTSAAESEIKESVIIETILLELKKINKASFPAKKELAAPKSKRLFDILHQYCTDIANTTRTSDHYPLALILNALHAATRDFRLLKVTEEVRKIDNIIKNALKKADNPSLTLEETTMTFFEQEYFLKLLKQILSNTSYWGEQANLEEVNIYKPLLTSAKTNTVKLKDLQESACTQHNRIFSTPKTPIALDLRVALMKQDMNTLQEVGKSIKAYRNEKNKNGASKLFPQVTNRKSFKIIDEYTPPPILPERKNRKT